MNILIYVSDNRIRPALVLIVSLCKNNKRGRINLYVATNKLSDNNRKQMNRLAEAFGTISITYVDLPKQEEITDENLVLEVQSVITGLPDNVEKLLYLDVNTLITGDITNLWNTELDGVAMAACKDENVYINELEEEYSDRVGIDKTFVWFSTAVMLIDVKYWCRRHIDSLMWDSYKESQNGDHLTTQQIFNRNLCGKIKYVPWGRYCVPTCFYRVDLRAVIDGNIEFASYKQINYYSNDAKFDETHRNITERIIQNAHIISYCNDESRPWKQAGENVYWVYRLYHSIWFEYEKAMLEYLD